MKVVARLPPSGYLAVEMEVVYIDIAGEKREVRGELLSLLRKQPLNPLTKLEIRKVSNKQYVRKGK